MIIITLIILASICNAIMDIITHKYAWSIFSKYMYTFNHQWWDPGVSWKNKYANGIVENGPRFPFSTTALVWTTDAFHLFKSIMIICLVTAITLGNTLPQICIFPYAWMNLILWIIILGTIWNLTFRLFYTKILKV